ncbi:MAG: TonB-dependent receptor [Cytophagaceae bacterium]|nr:TonB-dependent receptor [Cytophagaceae bacterium]MDW8455709.1 TonB-dependent receptor [Cytophagaceae bacterium]
MIFIKPAISQTITVLSYEDGLPIHQVHVVCKSFFSKNQQLFFTDSSGKATLSSFLRKEKKITIRLVKLGFQTIEDTLSEHIVSKVYYLHPQTFVMNEVAITAQYAPGSPENSVHKIKIIDRKKIEAQAAQNLRDLLSNELNIRLSQDHILGSSMSLQGISGQNVKILVDGMAITGRLNGNIDLSQINLNNVERIEIVEGPLSVNYGTDALAGTINIITRKSQKETFSTSLNSYYESIGQYNLSSRIGLAKNKHQIALSAGRYFFDGWRTNEKPFYYESQPVADSSRFKNWKPKEQYFGTLNYQYKTGTAPSSPVIGYTSDIFYEKITNRGMPRPPYQETALDDYYHTNRINNIVYTQGKITQKYNLNLMAAHNIYTRIKNTYFKDLTTLDQQLTSNPGDQDTTHFYTLQTRGNMTTSTDSSFFNYELGYDIYHETGTGLRIKNNKQTIGDYALFASSEVKPIKHITVKPALRCAYNSAYKAPFIPSLHLKYAPRIFKKNNNDFISLRLSYAHGFRAPTIKDLYFYFVDINHNIRGNESLKAEYSQNYSVSTTLQKCYKESVYKIELSWFYNDIKNLITLAQVNGMEYSYVNIGSYKTTGTQLNISIRYRHMTYTAGGSYIGRYNPISSTADVSPFSYAPEVRSNIIYEIKKINLILSAFYKYTGKLPQFRLNLNNEVEQTQVQDFHMADFTLSKYFMRKKILLGIGSKNLFDVTNISGTISGGAHTETANTISVATGRTYFLKMDINLNTKP